MRIATCAAAVFALGLAPLAGAATDTTAPVVLELFTSNSCSSCPPAYRTLSRLTAAAHSNAPVIRLDEHVDYWNQLDWVDRYSQHAFTERQRDYAHDVFHTGQVFTPQLVVDGRASLIGSHDDAARQAIDRFAGQVEPLSLAVSPAGQSLSVTVQMPAGPPRGRLWLALTEDDVVSHVGAGENAGRTLTEDGVVRVMVPVDSAPAGQSVTHRLARPADTAGHTLHVVALVQTADHRIAAAGTRKASPG